MFRDRTALIQKGIAKRKLPVPKLRAAERMEARLAKLEPKLRDSSEAEQKAVAEEQRIRQAAEEDKRKVVEAAESGNRCHRAQCSSRTEELCLRRWRSTWPRSAFRWMSVPIRRWCASLSISSERTEDRWLPLPADTPAPWST